MEKLATIKIAGNNFVIVLLFSIKRDKKIWCNEFDSEFNYFAQQNNENILKFSDLHPLRHENILSKEAFVHFPNVFSFSALTEHAQKNHILKKYTKTLREKPKNCAWNLELSMILWNIESSKAFLENTGEKHCAWNIEAIKIVLECCPFIHCKS